MSFVCVGSDVCFRQKVFVIVLLWHSFFEKYYSNLYWFIILKSICFGVDDIEVVIKELLLHLFKYWSVILLMIIIFIVC